MAVTALINLSNSIYSVASSGSNGWSFTALEGAIIKTITLDDTLPELHASYVINGTTVNKLCISMDFHPISGT